MLLLATLSQTDPHFVLDYDTFSLLATFFGWDSPLNLASLDARSLASWRELAAANQASSGSGSVDESSSEARASSSGTSSHEKESQAASSVTQGAPASPLFSSSGHDDEVSSDEANVPAPSEFPDVEASGIVETARKSLFSLNIFFSLTLFLLSRGREDGSRGLSPGSFLASRTFIIFCFLYHRTFLRRAVLRFFSF